MYLIIEHWKWQFGERTSSHAAKFSACAKYRTRSNFLSEGPDDPLRFCSYFYFAKKKKWCTDFQIEAKCGLFSGMCAQMLNRRSALLSFYLIFFFFFFFFFAYWRSYSKWRHFFLRCMTEAPCSYLWNIRGYWMLVTEKYASKTLPYRLNLCNFSV